MVYSSRATNPMEKAAMFRRTQFLRSGPAQNRQKSQIFGPLVKSAKGTNEDIYNQKITFSMVYSSRAANPMEKAAMFRRTQFLRFTGPDLRKIGKNHKFLAHSLKVQRGQTKTPTIKKSRSPWSIVAELPIPWRKQQCFVVPNFYVLQVGPAKNRQKSHIFGPLVNSAKGRNEDTYNPKTTLSMVNSSRANNPMGNAAMFCRTQFLRFLQVGTCAK